MALLNTSSFTLDEWENDTVFMNAQYTEIQFQNERALSTSLPMSSDYHEQFFNEKSNSLGLIEIFWVVLFSTMLFCAVFENALMIWIVFGENIIYFL